MDSFTHIVLGAVVGEAAGGKRLGRRAWLWGAAAQYLPDIDVVAALWLDPAHNLMVHRGITHSLLFVFVAGGGLALAFRRHDTGPGFWFWARFFGIQLFIHIFIDLFNAYGVGLFEPFSDRKFSFHTLYVADPLFTVWLLIAAVALIFTGDRRSRQRWMFAGLTASTLYLVVAVANKLTVTKAVQAALELREVNHTRLLVTPTPLNSLLWFVAAGNDSVFQIAHASVFDEHKDISFRKVPRRLALMDTVDDTRRLEYLTSFSRGYYTLEMWSDTLVFNDLRFGQMKGWEDPASRFVFHFYVNYPKENKLVMQRGRFAGWDAATVDRLVERIRSKD